MPQLQNTWTTLTEVRLKDADGGSAGNIDVVLCAYDDQGRVYDFGAQRVGKALVHVSTLIVLSMTTACSLRVQI